MYTSPALTSLSRSILGSLHAGEKHFLRLYTSARGVVSPARSIVAATFRRGTYMPGDDNLLEPDDVENRARASVFNPFDRKHAASGRMTSSFTSDTIRRACRM